MKNFTYYQPTTIAQAIGLLDDKWGKTELLAGGTDLLDLQKEYIAQPEKVITLNGIKELKEKGETTVGQVLLFPHGDKGGAINTPIPAIKIGAATTLQAMSEDKVLLEHFPALVAAASQVGGPQIRNMGTLGGNLCQRNRCWYFRDEHVNCLLKGGSKCFALDGENRYHAIFTQGHKCVIVHPSTLAPVLIALHASVEVQGPKGKRFITMAKFYRAPGGAWEREHVLAPNEIVLHVIIPLPFKVEGVGSENRRHNASYEVRHRQCHDWPLVQAVAAFKLDGKKASDVRIVLGHVAPTPHIAVDAAKALEGKEVTEETAAAAGKAATNGAKPLSQNAYKLKLVEVAVKRAILTAAGHKKYWEV